jgi:hypothetical protein
MKPFLNVLGASLLLALGRTLAPAQCAMCKVSAAASGSGAADSLNLAILVLLIPPVTIFCAIFIVAYRNRAARGETSCRTPKNDRASREWMDESTADIKGKGKVDGDSGDGRAIVEAT